ncbi:Rieske 2Fe-2S domain-containing protein [Haladaptatus sp. DFWS20]|uniref:Rieske 2Fe-2S domain-containing protein n=1 Tax=Haladaptatus sp. DFWS20 TaxID=3403467 RepID=UPI003EBA7C8B
MTELGDEITRTAGDRQLIIVRDHDGRIKAFDNVYTHRRSKIVEDMPMTDSENVMGIKCPHHLCTYDLDGNLRRTPKISRKSP